MGNENGTLDRDRPTYYGLANTLWGPLYFLPALGGSLLNVVGYMAIFVSALAALAIAYTLASRLDDRQRSHETCAASNNILGQVDVARVDMKRDASPLG